MNLNDLVKQYKKTGELPLEAYKLQLEFLLVNIQDIFQTFVSEYDDVYDSFEEYIQVCLNEFLVETGFVIEETFEDYEKLAEKELEERKDMEYNKYTKLGDDDGDPSDTIN